MNELIGTCLIFGAAFIAGGLAYIGSIVAPSIKNFIKWQIFRFKKDF